MSGIRAVLAVTVCLALAGCSTRTPTSLGHILMGHVVVRAVVSDATGNELRKMDLPAVSGLLVRLLPDSVRWAITADGAFFFGGCAPGPHAAVLFVAGVPTDTTTVVRMSGVSATIPDTLVFGTYGPVQAYPNPFAAGVRIQFALDQTDTVSVQVQTLEGGVVRQLFLGPMVAGVHAMDWDGTLESGAALAPGAYCVVVDRRAVLAGDRPAARSLRMFDVPTPGSIPASGPILCDILIKQ